MTTIIVPMEDQIIHTQEHPYCNDLTCPCSEELQAKIAEYRAQEDVEHTRNGYGAEQEPMTSGPRRIDWSKIFDDGASSREVDQERNITHQCVDGSWW